MSQIQSTVRTAAKSHRCTSCPNWIRPGERYRHTNVPPGGDLGFTGWALLRECSDCCQRYGRPIPEVAA